MNSDVREGIKMNWKKNWTYLDYSRNRLVYSLQMNNNESLVIICFSPSSNYPWFPPGPRVSFLNLPSLISWLLTALLPRSIPAYHTQARQQWLIQTPSGQYLVTFFSSNLGNGQITIPLRMKIFFVFCFLVQNDQKNFIILRYVKV